jgi:hypothetical protein
MRIAVADASIEQVRTPREIDPRFAGGLAVSTELASNPDAFGVFAEVNPDAGYLQVPNYLGSDGEFLQLPSVEVVTHRGPDGKCSRARIVNLQGADPSMAALYTSAAKTRRGRDGGLDRIAFATTQRMLETNGANGLHHIYGTGLDGATVYYNISNNGPNVYVARIGYTRRQEGVELRDGEAPGPIPVVAVVGATADENSARRLWKILGSAQQDRQSWRK